jgi:hypothetical protein
MDHIWRRSVYGKTLLHFQLCFKYKIKPRKAIEGLRLFANGTKYWWKLFMNSRYSNRKVLNDSSRQSANYIVTRLKFRDIMNLKFITKRISWLWFDSRTREWDLLEKIKISNYMHSPEHEAFTGCGIYKWKADTGSGTTAWIIFMKCYQAQKRYYEMIWRQLDVCWRRKNLKSVQDGGQYHGKYFLLCYWDLKFLRWNLNRIHDLFCRLVSIKFHNGVGFSNWWQV